MEEAILGGDETLGEKEVVLILGVDVRDSPAIAEDFHRFEQAGDRDAAIELGKDGLRSCAKVVGGGLGAGGGGGCKKEEQNRGDEESEADSWGFDVGLVFSSVGELRGGFMDWDRLKTCPT